MNPLGNIKIYGESLIGEGTYNDVNIYGTATGDGKIICSKLKVLGEADFEKALTVDYAKILGTVTLQEEVSINRSMIMGTLESKKLFKFDEIKILGSVKIHETMKGNKIILKGAVEGKGEVEAERVEGFGMLDLDGLLNCEILDLQLAHSKSFVKEIGGKSIRISDVRKNNSLLALTLMPFNNNVHFRSELIEGDDIDLRFSEVKLIRGHNVTIGKGCRIDRVEYTGSLNVLDNGVVKEDVKYEQ